MTRSQAQRIQEIIRSQDVRDPRETLDAIVAVLEEVPSILPEAESKTPLEELIDALRKGTEPEVPHLVPDNPKNEFGNPVAVLRIYNSPNSPGELKVAVALECCDNHILPRHILAAIRTLKRFADKKHKENAE